MLILVRNTYRKSSGKCLNIQESNYCKVSIRKNSVIALSNPCFKFYVSLLILFFTKDNRALLSSG